MSDSSSCTCVAICSLGGCITRALRIIRSVVGRPLFPRGRLRAVLSAGVRRCLIGASGISFLTRHDLLRSLCKRRRPYKGVIIRRSCRTVAPRILHGFCRQCCRSNGYSVFLSNGIARSVVQQIGSAFNSPFKRCRLRASGLGFPCVTIPRGQVFARQRSTVRDTMGVKCAAVAHRRPSCLGLQMLVAMFKNCFNDHLVSGVQRRGKCACNVSTKVVFCPSDNLLVISARASGRCMRPLVRRICRRVSHLRRRIIPMRRLSVIHGCVLNRVYEDCRSTFSLSST